MSKTDEEKSAPLVSEEENLGQERSWRPASAPASRPLGGNRAAATRRRRKKISKFDEWGIDKIDYKDVERLKEFLSEHAKILSRRTTGSSAKQQRNLTRAIKRARYMALLPYVGKIEKQK